MNTKSITSAAVRAFSYAVLPVILSACLEIETTTEVHPDGSLARTIVFAGDSSGLATCLRVLGIDSSWTLETKPPEGKKWTIVASRTFPSIEEMARVLEGRRGRTIQITPRLEKNFRWFFTQYRYGETWRKITLIDEVPLSEYLSAQEIEAIRNGLPEKEQGKSRGDSLAEKELGDRFMQWDARNSFEGYYKEFLAGVRALHDPVLTPALVESKKEELFQATFKQSGFRSGKFEGFREEFERILETSAVPRAFAANEAGIRDVEERLKFQGEVDGPVYRVTVVLPGIVTSTNATSVEGTKVTWKDFMTYCWFGDFDMSVESSVVNWWAIIFSAAVLLFIVVMTILGIVRGRTLRVRTQV
jgi:hypothetical protein